MLTPDVRYFLVRVADVRGCILWTGSTSANGYPLMRINGSGFKVGAHRWVWERLNGPIAEGVDIDHLCHVKLCVNPTHLRAVSRSENRGEGWQRLARRSRRDSTLPVPPLLSALVEHETDGQLMLWGPDRDILIPALGEPS